MRLEWLEEERTIWFHPHPTTRKWEMRRMRDTLKEAMASRRSSSVIFDLRHCDLDMKHLLFCLRTVLKHEPFMRDHLLCSTALIKQNRAVLLLSDLFFRLYSPVRPFTLSFTEEEAFSFVRRRGNVHSEQTFGCHIQDVEGLV